MKTITFYSYKGGVGRTLALANITNRLSEFNKKICLLDFDLEAPGLPHKFTHQFRSQFIQKGIVDYIHEFYVNGNLPESIKDYSYSFNIYGNKEAVNFIPAGNTNSQEYWKKLSAINWYDLLYEHGNGIAFFFDLKEKIRKEFNPDYLMIDSRTGITETSGITMSLFADEVVVLSANNRENLEGAQKIIKSLSSEGNSIIGKAPKIIFVLSRIPFTDIPEDKAKEQNLLSRVRTLFDNKVVEDIHVIHSDRELEENETLKIGYDKKDYSTPQVSRDYLKLFEEITKDDFSEVEIKRFEEIKLSERFYIKAISEERTETKIHLISEAIKLDSQNIGFYQYRASIYFEIKNYVQAISDYEIAIKIKPDLIDTYLSLAGIYFAREEYKDAIVIYNRALEINALNHAPFMHIIYCNIAIAYSLLNEFSNSVLFYAKAIEFNPSFSDAYNGRGNTYRLMGDTKNALNDVYKAIELNSDNSMAYATLAEINALLKKEDEFYINIELALKLAAEEKRKRKTNTLQMLENYIKEDSIYKPFYQKERFQKILEKYNIILLDEDITEK